MFRALLLAGLCVQLQAKERIVTQWNGSSSRGSNPSIHLVFKAADWNRLWKDSLAQEAPSVDFTHYFAAAVFLGLKKTGGYGVDFLEPETQKDRLILRYRVRAPAKNKMVTQAFTKPYAIRLYPSTPLKVSIIEAP